jgi:bacterial leucyl aminopeptidase
LFSRTKDRCSPSEGADDDGSGTVSILEAYRALITSDFRPVEHIEFHWYSAEVGSSMCSTTVLNFNACPKEGGLLGSQAVAKDYEARGVNVIAMSQVSRSYASGLSIYQSFKLQFDMTAWVKEGTREEVGIITDFVDPE